MGTQNTIQNTTKPNDQENLDEALDSDSEAFSSASSTSAWEVVDGDDALQSAADIEREIAEKLGSLHLSDEEEDLNLDDIENILDLSEENFPRFTLAKNKARFLRMVSWYRGKEEWIEVAPLSGVTKLFKQQTKELEGIRSSKLDYEMELETGTLTPSQRSYRRDELKMCRVQEKMAVHLISKLQVKIKSGRR
ncbi:MAG: hypothetical protein ACOYOK_09560 [Pseudobdellovibrionaceae bacterium]